MNKDYLIISNNPLVKENFQDTIYFQGTLEELLIKVRDMVHQGHELITHPLGASIRMMFSPYKSVLVSSEKKEFNEVFANIAENSIEDYRKNTFNRKTDYQHMNDYAMIDKELLEEALKEHVSLRAIN